MAAYAQRRCASGLGSVPCTITDESRFAVTLSGVAKRQCVLEAVIRAQARLLGEAGLQCSFSCTHLDRREDAAPDDHFVLRQQRVLVPEDRLQLLDRFQCRLELRCAVVVAIGNRNYRLQVRRFDGVEHD